MDRKALRRLIRKGFPVGRTWKDVAPLAGKLKTVYITTPDMTFKQTGKVCDGLWWVGLKPSVDDQIKVLIHALEWEVR